MTQLSMVAPHIFTEYAVKPEEELDAFLEEIIDGNIGKNTKSILLGLFQQVIDSFFDDPETSRLEAVSGYANLMVILREIAKDDQVIPRINDLYGPIVSSNFRFALHALAALIQVLLVAVQQPSEETDLTEDIDTAKLKQDLERIVSETDEMPDASVLAEGESAHEKMMSEVVIGYNIGLFMVLVIVVAALIKRGISLSSDQKQQMEILLRDWPQETMAQISVLGVRTKSSIGSVKLQGIIPDSDDFKILEEGMRFSSQNQE